MKRVIRFCGNMMIVVVAISMLLGSLMAWLNLGHTLTVLVSGIIGVFAMLAGMVIALVKERHDAKEKNQEMVDSITKSFEKQFRSDMRNAALSISRAVAERVSDRLVAKLSGLHNKEQRDAIFGDVDKILEEEMRAVSEAMEVESRLLKKS